MEKWKKLAIGSIAFNIFLIALGLFAFVFGNTTKANDSRELVKVSEEDKDLILKEMRALLESVHGIHEGISQNDRERAAKAAEDAGTKMVKELSAVERTLILKLPLPMKKLGLGTHDQFDKIAMELRKGEPMEKINQSITDLTARCVACHTIYKLR